METYFAVGIKELAQCSGISLAGARKQLKRRYDGYLFEEHAERVYNPFSLPNAFNNRKCMDYCFGIGMPTFLVKLMVRENVILENLGDVPVRPSKLNTLDSLADNPLSILYQSGYLTIDHIDDLDYYYLRFPNEEVERAFLQELLPRYTGRNENQAGRSLGIRCRTSFPNAEMIKMLESMK